MSTVIETISKDAADLYARTVLSRTVGSGRVEAYGLKWFSPVLKNYELNQKSLGRTAEVEVLVDEFDLSDIRVLLPNTMDAIRPVSTQPEYVNGLTLYEHQKIREHLREIAQGERLEKLKDPELLEQRRIFRATLGELADKSSRRQYARIMNSPVAASQGGGTSDAALTETPETEKPKRPAKPSPVAKASGTAGTTAPSKPPEKQPAPSGNEQPPPASSDTGEPGHQKPKRNWTRNFPATDAERPLS